MDTTINIVFRDSKAPLVQLISNHTTIAVLPINSDRCFSDSGLFRRERNEAVVFRFSEVREQ